MAEQKFVDLEGLSTFWEEAHKFDITEAGIVLNQPSSSVELSEASTGKGKKLTVKLQDLDANMEEGLEIAPGVNVGLLKAGQDIGGMEVAALLKAMLCQFVAPTKPTASAEGVNGIKEMGDSFSFNQIKVSCTLNSVKQLDEMGIYEQGGSADAPLKKINPEAGVNSSTFTLDEAVTGTSSDQVKHYIGYIKYKDDKQAVQTVSSSATGDFTWIYPFFYGTVDKEASTLSAEDVLGKTKDVKGEGNKSYAYTTNNNRAMIAYPKKYGTIKKITDSSGVTDYTNSFGSPAILSITSTNPAWGPVDYYVYTSGNATVTNFQYKFNF